MKCPTHLIQLPKNFLKNRKLRVKLNNSYSESFTPEQGLPQGSPLSPYLYNIYCHDISKSPSQNVRSQQEQDLSQYILQFADDTALITHSTTIRNATRKLQTLVDQTQAWFNKWRLKANPKKSAFIIFNHHPTDTSPTIKIEDKTIKPKTSAKYLGIQIDSKLNFNQHTQLIKKKCQTRAKHFRTLTYKDRGINMKTASHIYRCICRPLLEYAHPLSLNYRNQAKRNIRTAETCALRSITRMRHPDNPLHNPPNSLLYEKTRVTNILDRMTELTCKLVNKTEILETITPWCRKRPAGGHTRHQNPVKTLYECLRDMKL